MVFVAYLISSMRCESAYSTGNSVNDDHKDLLILLPNVIFLHFNGLAHIQEKHLSDSWGGAVQMCVCVVKRMSV